MSNLAVKSQTEYTIKVLSGPEQGATFKIMSPIIRIGRSSSNDIILAQDPKCSRNHAEINISGSGIIIKSLSSNNLITVDGKQGEVLFLKHDSKIVIGNSKLLFQISMLIPEHEPMSPAVVEAAGGLGPRHVPREAAVSNFSSPKANGSQMKIILIGAIAILLLFAFTQNKKSKQAQVDIRTEEQVAKDIEAFNQLKKKEEEARQKDGKENDNYKEAQSLYITGFRDFRKGQYERAISTFEACVSIYPKHDLCQTYKKLAEKKFQELIQYHMILGNKYLEKGQYQSCKSSLHNVMVMVKNPNSQVYKEAQSIYAICRSRLEGKY